MTFKLNEDRQFRIKKFNGGARAILCNYCSKIWKTGADMTKEDWESDQPVICDDCEWQFRTDLEKGVPDIE